LEDKEKVLFAVKQNVDVIKSDLTSLLQNTWQSKIQEIERSMTKAKADRRMSMVAAEQSQDVKLNVAIEKEYKQKMEALNKQL
jgi:hypothetical protein